MKTIMRLFMIECPLKFFGGWGLFLAALSIILAIPIIRGYFLTGLVPRMPTAVLTVGLMLSALLSFFSGLLLYVVKRGRHEVRHLSYLMIPSNAQLLRNKG